jgi:tetratricopeptide (TPR) repeat protein
MKDRDAGRHPPSRIPAGQSRRAMARGGRLAAAAALWSLAGTLCGSPVRAQTLGSSRTTIPDPEDAAVQQILTVAQADLNKKDFAGAEQAYSEYLSKKPNDAYGHFQLGFTYTNLHQPEKAATEYRRATELDPKMGAAYLNLGLTILDKDPASAVPPLQKATELLPDNAGAKFALGGALERSGQVSGAIEAFQAAIKLNGGVADFHDALGHALLTDHRPQEAEAEFHSALGLLPGSASARSGLIESLLAQKKVGEASAELETYLQAHPNDALGHYERASLLANQGKNDEALRELDQAAALGPEPVSALKLRANIDLAKPDLDAAVAALEKAAKLAPKDGEIDALLGHALLEKKSYPEAANALSQALRIDPKNTDALKDLLSADYEGGNYSATLRLLDVLSTRETLPAGSWFIRGTCYDKIGQKQEALGAYRKFLELNAGRTNDEYFVASARARTLERELRDKQ